MPSPTAVLPPRPTPAARRSSGLSARGLLALAAAAVVALSLLPPSPARAEVPHVLVFSGTFGFRHSSIGHGNDVIATLAEETDAFTVEFTEVPAVITPEKLQQVDMLLFNSTTGRTPFTAEQREALERYWGCGGGFVGVHAAADNNYGWPAYAELVGAQFDSHPHGAGSGEADLLVENAEHPVNAAYEGLDRWVHGDEYYRWRRDARGTQDVLPLLSLDEQTVAPGIQEGASPYVDDQPLSWVKTFRDRGRVYYTNLGHNESTWDRAEFRRSLVDGITWVGQVGLDGDCFTGDAPLPPPPAAPTPDPLDPDKPRQACPVEDGQVRLTPAGVELDAAHPTAPVYFGRQTTEVVLDLSGTSLLAADVAITHSWPVRTDDYDLAVASPWGFAGSDAIQPVAAPVERAVVEDAVHCTRLLVDVYNHAAVTGQAGTLNLTVNPPPTPEEPAPTEDLPPLDAVVLSPVDGKNNGFAPADVVITQGGELTLVNADIDGHSVICEDKDARQRPICRTPLIDIGQSATVEGVPDLQPGTYGYYCGLHPAMVGTITVL